jgi:hypothetical protein
MSSWQAVWERGSMTQVIGVITKAYALLASDRRLTKIEGSRSTIGDDDTCKLVNVCNTFGIGYTGLADFEDSPTHEWIAKTLASENCSNSQAASQILKDRVPQRLSARNLSAKVRQEFLMAGWGEFEGFPGGLHPFMRLVSNVQDDSGQPLAQPADSFAGLLKVLPSNERFFYWEVGQPITTHRREHLKKNLEYVAKGEVGPRVALKLLVDEIVHTSVTEKNPAVGSKVLGFCIPKSSVQRQIETGHSAMLAKQPDEDTATFTYFEPGFSELQQYGPTFVCGENAYTDVRTENDPARNFQSSGFKILSMPKREA